ncbi:hypothetical protein MMC20_007603 [Loxospora ochrophaea]|nr:hypothetical protein [Loxospora ochrophaea]
MLKKTLGLIAVPAVRGLAIAPRASGYALVDNFAEDTFFSSFSFFTGTDPTNGFVTYVDEPTAVTSHLIDFIQVAGTNSTNARISVDSTNITPQGRPSVRLTSQKSYNNGLLVADVAHMPSSTCGTWPALWMVGPNWPNDGEIDIIEGVNEQASNSMTLHTSAGCAVNNNSPTAPFSGNLTTPNCDVNAPGQSPNAGCQVMAPTSATNTFGSGFNSAGGGIYATEFTSRFIRIWFFPRSQIPADLLLSSPTTTTTTSPDPSTWGPPLAQFSGPQCDMASRFQNLQIVIDTTFCGAWAGSVWGSGGCAASTGYATCQDYVANRPEAFGESFWEVASLRMWQML